jgi:hypothetical protein
MNQIIENISHALLVILSWFKNPELMPVLDEGIEIEPKNEPKILKERFPSTLSNLLDNLEETFTSYKIPSYSQSFLCVTDRLGLKKLGCFVPDTEFSYDPSIKDEVKIDVSKGFPTMGLVALLFNKENWKDNRVRPDFAYFIKVKDIPWHIQKKIGVVYKFGLAWRDKKMFWQDMYVVINKNGDLEFCKEHLHQKVAIKPKNKVIGNYSKKVFQTASLISDTDVKDAEIHFKKLFKTTFEWWINRSDKWSVSVLKDKDRITFSVDKHLTKKYFADREKIIKTPTGKAKQIIHYVREHERNYGGKITKIKEHLRGVNKFEWKGYSCLVTAPEFHNLLTVKFNLSGVVLEPEEITKEYCSTIKAANMITLAEDKYAYRGHA